MPGRGGSSPSPSRHTHTHTHTQGPHGCREGLAFRALLRICFMSRRRRARGRLGGRRRGGAARPAWKAKSSPDRLRPAGLTENIRPGRSPGYTHSLTDDAQLLIAACSRAPLPHSGISKPCPAVLLLMRRYGAPPCRYYWHTRTDHRRPGSRTGRRIDENSLPACPASAASVAHYNPPAAHRPAVRLSLAPPLLACYRPSASLQLTKSLGSAEPSA